MTAGRIAAALAALSALLWLPGPAFADDTLTVIGGSNPAAFFEVLDDVAEAGGYFKDEHLSVTKAYAGVASTCAQLVASGKADVCSLSVEPIIQGYEKGLRLQFFFDRDPRYDYVIGVLPDSPIKTLADFKGKVIGEVNAGSAVEPAVISMLQGAGLKRGGYTFVPTGSGPVGLSAFVGKKVDALAFPSVELQTYEVWANIKIRYFFHPILKDIGNVGFAATPAVIAAKSDLLKRYARAMVKAAIVIRENPAVAARDFLIVSGQKVTGDAVAQEARVLEVSQADFAGVDPASKRIGYMPLQGMAVYSKFLNDYGLTAQVVPVASIVTNQFIDYANDFDHEAFIAQAKKLR
jgi:NitT/TauT family transport system substrate-binding protein